MIIHGDCLEEMRKMADNSISAIVTDPPYGLSFMGKGWDYAVPGIEYWQECLRILKPGANLLAMGGSRKFHRLVSAIEDSGFEIRDCIMWIFGSGFPKSHNHFGIEGFGTALKPAYEPIIMAMKPLEGTFAQNAEKWGQAGINIDGCRVFIDREDDIHAKNPHTENKGENKIYGAHKGSSYIVPKGRWPANVIFDEEAGEMLDEQSGHSVSRINHIQRPRGAMQMRGENSRPCHGKDFIDRIEGVNDSGGASRFFYCAKASSSERNEGLDGLPLKEKKTLNEYVNPSEGRTASKSGAPMANNHPTVKPLKLMEYLIRLVMPPKDGILLDPFAGSGTTILAAKRLGFQAIGIEKQEEYCKIARARLNI